MIRAENLVFEIGDFRLDAVDLEMLRDEYFVLLGPPGSGKSIFLECLCGLRKVKSGRILLNGKDITHSEPRSRNIGYVPQDYALFPHLTVEKNIAFGLRAMGTHRSKALQQARQTAEMLGIAHLLKRDVLALSGGETQRTALARALVMKPQVLLLDEPVCALDEATRQSICAMLRRVQKELELTVMHVSHNLEEAFSVASRAAILNRGRLQQVGPLDQLLRKPANEFVARFMRCENIYSADVVKTDARANCTRLRMVGVELEVDGLYRNEVKLIVRPEDVVIVCDDHAPAETNNRVGVRMTAWRDFGSFVRADFEGPVNLVAHLSHGAFAEVRSTDPAKLTAVLRRQSIHILQ